MYDIIINLKEGSAKILKIKELTIQAFSEFTKNSPLKNYMQTEEYARLMGEDKYNYDYIGLVDETGLIRAASIILWKRIGFSTRYGYAPKGFLINYYDEELLKTFTEELRTYYAKKNFAFIKINPEIVIGEIDNKTFEFTSNPNIKLKQDIQRFGFLKLKDNLYFESINPRYNAYIDLKNANITKYSKANRNKIRNSRRKGLFIEKGTKEDIETFYKMINTNESLSYYRNIFNIFKDKLDFLLVKVNYENYIKNAQSLYEQEENKNNLYNEIIHRSNKITDLHRKMASDALLENIKAEILEATNGLRTNNNIVVAAAFVIKYDNRVHIIESAYDKNYKKLNANYFLYDSIINNYKDEYEFLDIGGVVGDFKKNNVYSGLNRFKIGFNPKIYEYIGEFDLIFNRITYDNLLMTGRLANEFNKNN